MKNILFLFSATLIISCTSANVKTYIASTPADAVVRNFLGIPLTDSVDFIRWKLVLSNNNYQLETNYGISKPNTNGFINGGYKVTLSGGSKTEENILQLLNGNKVLKIIKLNDNLLHILNDANNLLNGNSGWSYTLNNNAPVNTGEISTKASTAVLKDSLVYTGRTPCKVPGLTGLSANCYKLKWKIVLYADAEKNVPASYKIYATNWRREPLTGTWNIMPGKAGQIIYVLNDGDGKVFISLLKLDEQILLFAGASGELPVGDGDFSYTLNRNR